MKSFKPIRGTNDYGPKQERLREIVREKILKSYQSNGYNLISTPILESLEFLNSSEGGDNLRLMFKTIKRGDKLDLSKPNLAESDITEEGLRYDLTVPLTRFYLNNRDKLPNPFKAIQIGYSFRAERPQRGRDRQFIQCDIDIFGDNSINCELELLKTAIDTYNLLGFNNLTLKINSREILNSIVLFAGFNESDIVEICTTLDKIDKIDITGVMMELVEKGYDTEKINKLISTVADIREKGLKSTLNYGADKKVVNDLSYLISTLKKLTNNANIVYDISIVRGQGYYTGPIYEFYTEGFSGAIGAGGRYNNMVKKFAGVDVPACGASIGFEPVIMLLTERKATFDAKENLALLFEQDDDIVEVYSAKEDLKNNYNVSLYEKPKNMKNFYEKISEVASFVTSFKDYKQNKPIKQLEEK